ncbi:hypothetical protein DsansV1_C04g0041351 [Dioscorea sansibarensis]
MSSMWTSSMKRTPGFPRQMIKCSAEFEGHNCRKSSSFSETDTKSYKGSLSVSIYITTVQETSHQF